MHKTENMKNIFKPGSEWLYIKIYCGVYASDEILVSKIKPIAEILKKENKITHWFFIRYSDPENHLRIRFHISDKKNISKIIEAINKALNFYFINKIIWKISLDTYVRELERYGFNTIEEAEYFFYYDSKQVLNILETNTLEKSKFIMIFSWIEIIMSQFKFKDEALISFLDINQKKFKNEFNVNYKSKKELGIKYNDLIKNISDKEYSFFSEKDNILFIISSLRNKLSDYEKEKQVLASLIHMSINRLFLNNQRLYEMVLYDFLYKKIKTKFIRYGKI